MSILIKGMEMPESCYYCPFADGVWQKNKRCLINGKEMPRDGRDVQQNHINCPLIELPPHGRLIDADALNELIDSGDDIDFSEVPKTKYAIMQMVNEQDTILEASPYRYKMIGKTDKPHGIYFIERGGEE